jgi:hypothetical protein
MPHMGKNINSVWNLPRYKASFRDELHENIM